jgi:23S rRNA (adenine2030-N6)-methyltransferase
VTLLRHLPRDPAPIYIDTHAGEGIYKLGGTGEWSEGIGRLLKSSSERELPPALADYLTTYRSLVPTGEEVPKRYPGSPAIARSVLGASAEYRLWEQSPEAFRLLRSHVGSDPKTLATCGDGLASLAQTLREARARSPNVVALIDPPWSQKPDWIDVPRARVSAVAAVPTASVVLWYPVKSLTRPNAMHAMLREAGLESTFAELVTTPVGQRRNRLNGSGVLLVRPPRGTLEALMAAAPAIGERCATVAGRWSLRVGRD